MRVQAGIGTVQDAQVHGPAVVAAGNHFIERRIQQAGQTLSAHLRVTGQGGPACCHVSTVGGSKTLRRAHLAIVKNAALHIAAAIDRCQLPSTKVTSGLAHHARSVGIHRLKGGDALPVRRGVEPVLDNEGHVGQGRGVVTGIAHADSLETGTRFPEKRAFSAGIYLVPDSFIFETV